MRGKDTHRTEYTGGQLNLAEIIIDMGFSTDLEREFPPYCVDIFIEELWAAVEFDGAHSMKKRDRKRDEYLVVKYNLPVLRMTKTSPKEEVKKKLLEFFKECADSAKARKQGVL